MHVHISLIVPLDSARDSEEKDNLNILLYFLAKRFNLHIHLLKRIYQTYKFNTVPSKPVQRLNHYNVIFPLFAVSE